MYFWIAVKEKYRMPGENLARLKSGEVARFDRACNDRDEGSLPSLWEFIGEGVVVKVNGKVIEEDKNSRAA